MIDGLRGGIEAKHYSSRSIYLQHAAADTLQNND